MTTRERVAEQPAWWRDESWWAATDTVDGWLARLERQEQWMLEWQARVFAACAPPIVVVEVEPNGMPARDALLSITDAARTAGLARNTLQSAIDRGKVRTYAVFGATSRRVRFDEVSTWQRDRRAARRAS